MPDVVIMTDSNSGMTQEEGKKYGVEIRHEEFFQKLGEDAQVSTSQPAPGEVIERWETLLKRHDEVVYIPMSGALSKSCETAQALAEDYNGRVQVVDSRRVSIYIAADTLKYLKRGGRITGTAAALGTVLNIKPVLVMKGEKLDSYEKARGMKAARRIMLQAIRGELEGPFKPYAEQDEVCLQMAHTCMDEELVREWEEKIREEFPDLKLDAAPLPLCTACHIGPNGLGIGITRRIRKDW